MRIHDASTPMDTMTNRFRPVKGRGPELERFDVPDTISTVMVTGAGGYWGTRTVLALENDPRIQKIIAVDRHLSNIAFHRAETVAIDLTSPLIVDMVAHQKVDVLVHLQLAGHHDGREHMFGNNVLGSRHLLAAAREAGVRHVITRSSTFVYGAQVSNPYYLDESAPVRANTRHPYVKDLADMERDYASAWGHPAPRPVLTVLRFAPIVGATCTSQMSLYLKNPILYTGAGFDPLWQFTHEDDVIRGILHAVRHPYDGPINIGGDRPLPVSLIARRMGRYRLPVTGPIMGTLLKAISSLPRVAYPSIPTNHLRYACMGDTTRMKEEFEFTTSYTTPEALNAFMDGQTRREYDPSHLSPEMSDFARRTLEEILEQN